ncbi:MAG TPA: PDR/VanB family oxidoreductase [Burkholderiales bacterium]
MRTVRVAQIQREATDILSFELAPSDGRPLPPYAPGAHIDVHLAPDLIRQYSLCDAPDSSDKYRIAVKREEKSRGGSRAMHETVQIGAKLEIGEPRNNFPLAASASRHLLVAGGIGVTPLLSMAQHLWRRQTPFELQYFTRSREHAAFHTLLSSAELRDKVRFHYGYEAEQVRDCLHNLLRRQPDGTHLYVCGPRPFMDLVESTATPALPRGSVHLEYFSADPASLSGPREAFEIAVASTGSCYRVPADKSIVQVLAENGIDIPVSCEQGVCGTCLTGVVDGVPDHRDVFLTDEERRAGKRMLLCVSRARTPRITLAL